MNPYQAKKYRKKPEIVKAYQAFNPMQVNTAEGVKHVPPGDWVVVNANNICESVSNEVFQKMYERVEQEDYPI